MKYTYKFDTIADSYIMDFDEEKICVGDEVLVYSECDTMTGKEWFNISKLLAHDGYPGNVDSSIRRYHGWRGTTNDIAVYAYGVYTVKSVTHEDGDFRNQYLKVVINHKDIRKGDD